MFLTKEEESILEGDAGYAKQKAMQILTALGDIFGAEKLIRVKSVQIAGVSYHNLGDAGLEFLRKLAKDGKVSVLSMLNPAGMDLEDWQKLGIPKEFAKKQKEVIAAYTAMGVEPTCTCTPYLIGYAPKKNEHVAWSESSAVTFVNSVIGAKTNREGGPSALAAAIVGKTPYYGLHLDENRKPTIHIENKAKIESISDFGALGYCIGKVAENQVPYITGIENATLDNLKSFSASVVTYGAQPLFHIKGMTPEASNFKPPNEKRVIKDEDIKEAYSQMFDSGKDIDFVCIGCPHCSIEEIATVANLLSGKKINDGVEFWVATARQTKKVADKKGYTKIIEDASGKFACDTCMVVAPLEGRFKTVGTTSAKACYYSRGHNKMKTRIGTIEDCVTAAINGKWS